MLGRPMQIKLIALLIAPVVAVALIGAAVAHRYVVHFSPNGGCEAALVAELAKAKHVKVMAYSFTSEPIAEALAGVVKRGGTVTAILDKHMSEERGGQMHVLQRAGVHVCVDGAHAIFHNKVMLIDGHTLATGSFNFTPHAEHNNAENSLILHDVPALVADYEADFEKHLKHSEKVK